MSLIPLHLSVGSTFNQYLCKHIIMLCTMFYYQPIGNYIELQLLLLDRGIVYCGHQQAC